MTPWIWNRTDLLIWFHLFPFDYSQIPCIIWRTQLDETSIRVSFRLRSSPAFRLRSLARTYTINSLIPCWLVPEERVQVLPYMCMLLHVTVRHVTTAGSPLGSARGLHWPQRPVSARAGRLSAEWQGQGNGEAGGIARWGRVGSRWFQPRRATTTSYPSSQGWKPDTGQPGIALVTSDIAGMGLSSPIEGTGASPRIREQKFPAPEVISSSLCSHAGYSRGCTIARFGL